MTTATTRRPVRWYALYFLGMCVVLGAVLLLDRMPGRPVFAQGTLLRLEILIGILLVLPVFVGIARAFLVELRGGMLLPVLMKEMRSRMRGARAPWMLFISAALASGIGLLILASQWDYLSGHPQEVHRTMTELGESLFIGMAILGAVLAVVMAPALTSASISLEHEQHTFEFLLLTRLSNMSIVAGKLLSSLSFLTLVLLSALPVASLSFLFGGVSVWQFLMVLLLVGATVLCFGAIGLFCSARFRKTATAIVVSYTICVAWLALLPLTYVLMDMFRYHSYGVGNIYLYLLLTIVILLTFATMPTAAVVGTLYLVKHRSLPRSGLLALWGLFASLACLLLYLPGVTEFLTNAGNLFLFANPVVAFVRILDGSIYDPSGGSYYYWGSMFVEWLSVGMAIGLLLLGAWSALVLTVREVRAQRG